MKDVTIIGAGPAGSAAALMLIRRGWAVTLIEQHRFPRDKVCGECVSALGIEVLDRLGITPRLRAAGAVSLTRAIIHGPNGQSVITALPEPMLGISRQVMDAMLLDAARNAGATIRQPVRCEGIANHVAEHSGSNQTGTSRLSVRIRDLEQNTIESLSPSLILLADGKSALPDASPPATGDIGIKSHWTNLDGPRDVIELFGCRGCYGGLAAIEGERWNAAFSVPANRVREYRGDIDALFAELVAENRALARRMSGAKRSGPWLASPLPRYAVRRNWVPGVIPLGNAAAAVEPIGGEGMGLALRSAELAAEMLIADGTWSLQKQRALQSQYRSLWRIRRFGCRLLAMAISSSQLMESIISMGSSESHLAPLALRLLGKGAK